MRVRGVRRWQTHQGLEPCKRPQTTTNRTILRPSGPPSPCNAVQLRTARRHSLGSPPDRTGQSNSRAAELPAYLHHSIQSLGTAAALKRLSATLFRCRSRSRVLVSGNISANQGKKMRHHNISYFEAFLELARNMEKQKNAKADEITAAIIAVGFSRVMYDDPAKAEVAIQSLQRIIQSNLSDDT